MDSSRPRFTIEDVGLSMGAHGAMFENSVLCFDGTSPDHLTFQTSASPAWSSSRLPARRVMVSEDAYAGLTRRFPKMAVLAAKYMRPLSMGNLELELLPSGESAGSSFLLVRKGSHSLLCVSHWSPEKDPHVRQMILKQVTRIFWKPMGDPLSPQHSPRTEMERLATWIQANTADGSDSHLLLNPVRDLPRLIPFLAQSGISFTVDAFSQPFLDEYHGPHSLVPADGPQLRLYSFPSLALFKKKALPAGRWASAFLPGVDAPLADLPPNLALTTTFQLFSLPTLSDFLKMASQVGAREVVVAAPQILADALVPTLQSHRLDAWVLAVPRTETLF